MSTTRLILDHVYQHEAEQGERIFLTQPVGNAQVVNFTWRETLDQARRMAAHLSSLGFEPGARIAMLAKNSAHFFMVDLACWMAGLTTVAIFPTESAQNVRYVLAHSGARLLFIGKLDTWEQQKAGVPEGLRCIALPLSPLAPDANLEHWDVIVSRTAPITGRPQRAPEDLALLLYTSGSTGQPKGVMQSFGSISHVAQSIVNESLRRYGDEPARMLSYLPLAHCYERAWVECAALVSGNVQIFFSESQATFIDDIKRARPTTFISVPRLWTKFQQAVLAQMPAAQLEAMLDNPATAAAVSRKVLAGLGLEEVVRAGSGSAPLPAELMRWYRRLGLNLLEGYAMTEDFAYSHASTESTTLPGHVGAPFDDVQARLGDDGEVLVKSPGRMAGYYLRPDLNAECFTADGFFHTGDLGQYTADGVLKLTGRKKELFKTAKGKYVAPAPIENLLHAHPMVELACVSGVGQAMPYALLVLDENLRPKLGDADVRAKVEASLSQLLLDVNQGLAAHERLRMLVVAREPWSIDNGYLTPTMKIKRSAIEASVQAQLDGWYTGSGAVLWQ